MKGSYFMFTRKTHHARVKLCHCELICCLRSIKIEKIFSPNGQQDVLYPLCIDYSFLFHNKLRKFSLSNILVCTFTKLRSSCLSQPYNNLMAKTTYRCIQDTTVFVVINGRWWRCLDQCANRWRFKAQEEIPQNMGKLQSKHGKTWYLESFQRLL